MSRLTMMLSLSGAFTAMIATPAAAANGDEDVKAVAQAIMARDYISAESRIAAMGPSASSDPAMLINLGNAYAGMGRRADAQLAYRAALKAAPDEMLEMADGSVRPVRDVAGSALQQLGVSYAGR